MKILEKMNRKEIKEVVGERKTSLAWDLVSVEQRERMRISQILHDDMQQQLYAIQMQVQLIRAEMDIEGGRPINDSTLTSGLDEIEKLVSGSLKITRGLMLDLNPPLAKGTGLLMSFEWLGWQMLNTYGLEVTVKGDDSAGELDHNLHRLLFQMVRELLLNVVEHAQVKEAEITVETEEDGVTVTVSDEGRGFDIDRVMAYRGNGLGLRNIDVWLKLFGRGVEIKSAPGQGTQVTLFMPIVR